MRSAERNPIGRLAIVVGVLAIVFAVTVPGALGRSTAGGPVTNYLTYVGGKAGKANPKLSTRLSRGEKRNRKRMAEVGGV